MLFEELFKIKIKKIKITNEIIQKYKIYLFEEERAKSTIEKYIRDVSKFSEWLCGKPVEKSIVLEYKNMLCEKYAPASVNSILSSLNNFFSFNEWFKCRVKTLKIQTQIFCQSEKELSKSEYERLLKAAKTKNNERLFYLMQTICSTGIRISELKYITVAAVKTEKQR